MYLYIYIVEKRDNVHFRLLPICQWLHGAIRKFLITGRAIIITIILTVLFLVFIYLILLLFWLYLFIPEKNVN